MAVLNVDWTTKTGLPYGWFNVIGPPMDFGTDGVGRTGYGETILAHSKNMVDPLGTTGTSYLIFTLETEGGLLCAADLRLYPYGTNPAGFYSWHGVGFWVNSLGSAWLQWKGYSASLGNVGTDFQGTISSYWSFSGSVGTMQAAVHSGGSALGTLDVSLGTDVYFEDIAISPYVGIGVACQANSTLRVQESEFQVTPATAMPLAAPTLFYEGTYNDGSSVGVVNLSSLVIKTTPLQQGMYFPSAGEGVFSAEVNVTVKDDSGQWGTFVGSTPADSFHPPGLFYVRNSNINAGEEDLFVGFINPASIEYDEQALTVSFELESIFHKLQDTPVVTPQAVATFDPRSDESDQNNIFAPREFGIVSSVVGLYGQPATVTVIGAGLPVVETDDLITLRTDGDELCAIEAVTSSTGVSAVFTVSKRPLWLLSGELLNANVPRLVNSKTLLQFYQRAYLYPFGKLGEVFWGGASPMALDPSVKSAIALQDFPIQPSHKYNGMETFGEILADVMGLTGGGAGWNGNGISIFLPTPSVVNDPGSATTDPDEVFWDSKITGGLQPLQEVTLKYAWDDETKRYTKTYHKTEDREGRALSISSRLLSGEAEAAEMASILMLYYRGNKTRSALILPALWNTYGLGARIMIENELMRDEMVLSRAYDPAANMVSVETVQINELETESYFQVGDDIGGTKKVL